MSPRAATVAARALVADVERPTPRPRRQRAVRGAAARAAATAPTPAAPARRPLREPTVAPAPRRPRTRPQQVPRRRRVRARTTARARRSRGSAAAAALIDRLLRARLWIWLVAALLVGIVFLNVDLLQLNRRLAAISERRGQVEADNARLRRELARLEAADRIQQLAQRQGFVLPAPDAVRYLHPQSSSDVRIAAQRLGERAASRIPAPGEVSTAGVSAVPTLDGQP
ncbi:hypothetical protein [Thermoleophilum album]|uniref:Cell division protein FtsL n=1 Tax=Thermoleophilum album TaxID=29539 RepID=A0A1H6FX23_THEAL|nr:hypothetical protein [Thermoleophilum album]SEH15361.1 cell division protein FtsL [Thermoleophilum album]